MLLTDLMEVSYDPAATIASNNERIAQLNARAKELWDAGQKVEANELWGEVEHLEKKNQLANAYLATQRTARAASTRAITSKNAAFVKKYDTEALQRQRDSEYNSAQPRNFFGFN